MNCGERIKKDCNNRTELCFNWRSWNLQHEKKIQDSKRLELLLHNCYDHIEKKTNGYGILPVSIMLASNFLYAGLSRIPFFL